MCDVSCPTLHYRDSCSPASRSDLLLRITTKYIYHPNAKYGFSLRPISRNSEPVYKLLWTLCQTQYKSNEDKLKNKTGYNFVYARQSNVSLRQLRRAPHLRGHLYRRTDGRTDARAGQHKAYSAVRHRGRPKALLLLLKMFKSIPLCIPNNHNERGKYRRNTTDLKVMLSFNDYNCFGTY
jgi:hypothetical protein